MKTEYRQNVDDMINAAFWRGAAWTTVVFGVIAVLVILYVRAKGIS